MEKDYEINPKMYNIDCLDFQCVTMTYAYTIATLVTLTFHPETYIN